MKLNILFRLIQAYNVDAPTFWPHSAEEAKAEN